MVCEEGGSKGRTFRGEKGGQQIDDGGSIFF